MSFSRVLPARFRVVPWLLSFAALVMITSARPLCADDEAPRRRRPAAKQKKVARPIDDSDSGSADNPFPNRPKSPDLDGGTGWLNTNSELTLRDLRGKVVLLDFWTYCCINCMHILPDLKYLEHKYDKQLVVIGVHSAKFDNERGEENIRRAIMRYEIAHPVINDSERRIWRKFNVDHWPTFVLIDPEGNYCGSLISEGHRAELDDVIGRVVAYHRKKGTLDESPVRFDLERDKIEPTPLRFPGKVLADDAGDRLFISDSNYNRIVITSLGGQLREVIGTGAIGKDDGSYDRASFDHPQGMALVHNTLYVADTENHLIRAIDLDARQVRTVAGTGHQSPDWHGGGPALSSALNSPWDLVPLGGRLYIAMAGHHQVWVFDIERQLIAPYAGSGREDVLNGRFDQAALAQPSGITTDGKSLFLVDSEGSAVREVSLNASGGVTTIVGTSDFPDGRSLFEFGDRDGVGGEARLQHPLGITYFSGALLVADSYNHKIKRIDPVARTAKTILGNGRPGDQDRPARFSEPAGLSVARGTLYVADTNNHHIRTVDLKSGAVSTLEIAGLTPPSPPKPPATDDDDHIEPVTVKPHRVAAGESLTFEVSLEPPRGYKLNKLSPISYRLKAEGDQTLLAPDQLDARQAVEPPKTGNVVTFHVPLAAKSGTATLQVTVDFGYCRSGKGGLCKLGTEVWSVPVEIAQGATERVIRLAPR
jgi:thiol-disulfide isomerase/thioredoxin